MMKFLDWLATIFVLIGALNWGLVAWFGFNIVTWIDFFPNFVYSIVAVSAVYAAIRLLWQK